MFADSMFLHAMAEAQNEQRRTTTDSSTPYPLNASKENIMVTTEKKTQQQQQQATQKDLQPQPQSQPQIQPEAAPLSPVEHRVSTDPLGRPMYQGSPRFTDQQAGGDLTGDESDARDDNFVPTGASQNARDVSAHANKLSAAAAELLRMIAVDAGNDVSDSALSPQSAPASQSAQPQIRKHEHGSDPDPDGSEDPGANADDDLTPRRKNGGGSEQQ